MRAAPRTFDGDDANVWLTVTEAQLIKGDRLDPEVGRVPLAEYMTTGIAERPLADRTADRYARLMRLHIAPRLGRLDLVDVTPERVRSWRATLLASGVARRRWPSRTGCCKP